jgi:transcriptional regulator with XRE-family HTH domain
MESARVEIGRHVAELRHHRGLTVRRLSERLGELGHPMLPSVISKLEKGNRSVDVDDLIALAVALRVNPSRLWLPFVADETEVALTPVVRVPAWAAWQWSDGSAPLPTLDAESGYNTDDEAEDFQIHARPAEVRRRASHPAARALARVGGYVVRSIASPPKGRDRQVQRAGYERAQLALNAEFSGLLSRTTPFRRRE